MTLTQELGRSDSVLRRFIDAHFGERLRNVRADLPAETREALRRPLLRPDELRGGEIGTVGTAFDYRVRFFYEALPVRPWAAAKGAARFGGTCVAPTKSGGKLLNGAGAAYASEAELDARECVVAGFFTDLLRLLEGLGAPRQPLPAGDEELLDRYCLVLALFEQLYRAPFIDSPLFALPSQPTLDDLLALPSDAQVKDLGRLSQRFEEEMKPARGAARGDPEIVGAERVGGADADLLLGTCLIELKATQGVSLPGCLRQLLGYVLLDFTDALHVRRVAVYFARHSCYLEFPLEDLISGLISRRQGFEVWDADQRSDLPLEENLAGLRSSLATQLPRRRRAA